MASLSSAPSVKPHKSATTQGRDAALGCTHREPWPWSAARSCWSVDLLATAPRLGWSLRVLLSDSRFRRNGWRRRFDGADLGGVVHTRIYNGVQHTKFDFCMGSGIDVMFMYATRRGVCVEATRVLSSTSATPESLTVRPRGRRSWRRLPPGPRTRRCGTRARARTAPGAAISNAGIS
jgi:hypothetical protein